MSPHDRPTISTPKGHSPARVAHRIISSKIPKAVLTALAQKVRESPETLRNLAFTDATTSLMAVKTEDLRFDVYKNTQNPNIAIGIIQANNEAKNKAIKGFIKGSSASYKGIY